MKIGVYGIGYVGAVTAVQLSATGKHEVIGVEVNKAKRSNLNAGKLPFFEPGMQEEWETRKIKVSGTVIDDCDVSLICVGTPTCRYTEELDISTVIKVAVSIAKCAPDDHLIVVRSTMNPGGMFLLNEAVQAEIPTKKVCNVVFMPEFLREGCALKDVNSQTINPFGFATADQNVATKSKLLAKLTDIFSIPLETIWSTGYEEIEILKLANNAWHATKITFANEISRICWMSGANSKVVMNMLCQDTQKNVSRMYMEPGFAWGGSCLPKDVRQLQSLLPPTTTLIGSLNASNSSYIEFCRERIEDTVREKDADKLVILGVAFKANTDDLRESAVTALINRMCQNSVNFPPIYTYDPHVALKTTDGYGTSASTLGNGIITNAVIAITQWNDAYIGVLERCDDESCVVIDLFNARSALGEQKMVQDINAKGDYLYGIPMVGISW